MRSSDVGRNIYEARSKKWNSMKGELDDERRKG